MKAIIGYDKEQKILAAVIAYDATEQSLGDDVLSFLRSGLTVNCVEINSITIGDKFDWSKTKIVEL